MKGLSRFTQQDSQQTKSDVGPLKWMSLESLTNRVYSTKVINDCISYV